MNSSGYVYTLHILLYDGYHHGFADNISGVGYGYGEKLFVDSWFATIKCCGNGHYFSYSNHDATEGDGYGLYFTEGMLINANLPLYLNEINWIVI